MVYLKSIIQKGYFLLFLFVIGISACQSNQESNDDLGESEEITQTPSLPEARKPTPDTIRLELKEFVYLPPKVIVPPGGEVFFILTNNGDDNHRIFFEFPYGNVEVEEPISPGDSDSLTVKIPEQEGTYTIYCPMENGMHRENGMRGEIIVKEEEL